MKTNETISGWQYFWCWLKGHHPSTAWYPIGSLFAYLEVKKCPKCKWRSEEEKIMDI